MIVYIINRQRMVNLPVLTDQLVYMDLILFLDPQNLEAWHSSHKTLAKYQGHLSHNGTQSMKRNNVLEHANCGKRLMDSTSHFL